MSSDTKVYVGNLAHATTKESLEDHFAQYGEIAECVVMLDKGSGQSRGFGFVTFTASASMEGALRASHNVDGKAITCKRAVRDTRQSGKDDSGGGGGMYNVVKIFVGGLPASCDLEKLKSHFGQYGEIHDAVVMMDAQTQRHRGFGFVTFKDPKGVEAALSNDKLNKIDNKWVEVKRCMPQEVMRARESGKKVDDDRDDDRPSGPQYHGPPPGGPPPPGYYPPPVGYGGYPGYPPPGAYGGYPYGYYPPPPPDYYAAYGYPPPHAYPYGGYPPPVPTSSEPDEKRSRSRSRRRRRRG
mmetsp:Transcript_35470/g.66047  ORF Transcript_35470/g.66047 Transcript_35470/m.66047 type:complete len:297 (+) Transcript_35470:45-935(+)